MPRTMPTAWIATRFQLHFMLLLLLPALACGGGILYNAARDLRFVQAFATPTGGVAIDSAYAAPNPKLSDFLRAVSVAPVSLPGSFAYADQSSRLDSTQIRASGTVSLREAPMATAYTASATSRFHVGFSLNEAHTACLRLTGHSFAPRPTRRQP